MAVRLHAAWLQLLKNRAALLLLLHCSVLAYDSSNVPMNTSGYKDCVYTYSSNVAANGTFSTPGYPKSYPPDTRCRFRFRGRPDQVVWILWSDFHLEGPLPHQRCLHDYVEVIVIDRQNVQHISGRYCGSRKPPDFRTMQQSVDIIFQSSFSKHFQGFSGIYMFINEREVQPPMSRYPGKSNPHSIGCGGFAQGTYGGVIKSPEYPSNYPADVECNWIIRVRSDKQIFIKILELQLTPGFQCEDAQLDVFDGYAHYNPGEEGALSQSQRVRFCGEEKYYREEGDKSYMSDRNRIHVRFKTTKPAPEQMKLKRQEYGSAVGFYMVWTEVSINANCGSFYCRGGEYCIDEGKSICAERKRYCIDNSLVCDGVPNCAEFDNSDEESCYSKELLVSGLCLLALLVLLIVIIVHWQRCRGRKLLSQLMRGKGASARRPMDLMTEHKKDGWQNMKPVENSVKVGPKVKSQALSLDPSTAAIPEGDQVCWEVRNHVGGFGKPPTLAYKNRTYQRPEFEMHSLDRTPASLGGLTGDDDSEGVWKQRQDAANASTMSLEPLVTSLSDNFQTISAMKSQRPGPALVDLQLISTEISNQIGGSHPITAGSTAKNRKLPRCILKTSQSSSMSSDASEIGPVKCKPNAETYESRNRLPRVDSSGDHAYGQRSLRRPTKQRVEFSDIVTVRIRPPEDSDKDNDTPEENHSPVDHQSLSKAIIKPTVV